MAVVGLGGRTGPVPSNPEQVRSGSQTEKREKPTLSIRHQGRVPGEGLTILSLTSAYPSSSSAPDATVMISGNQALQEVQQNKECAQGTSSTEGSRGERGDMIRNCSRQNLAAALIITGCMVSGLADAQPADPTTTKKTIFDYKAELNLTNEQEQEIRQILAELNREAQLAGAKLTVLKFELEDLIQKEDEVELVRKNLIEEAELRASIKYADLAATRKINNVLSAEQLLKWRSFQEAARKGQ